MKQNNWLTIAACFLIAAFFIITSNHVRVEHAPKSDYSKYITQSFHWKNDGHSFKTPTLPKFDKDFFQHIAR